MPLAPGSRVSYSQAFRVIGQSLEKLNLKRLDLELLDGEFVVRLRHVETVPGARGRLGGLLGSAPAKTQETTLERRYTIPEIEELDQEERKRRAGVDSSADSYMLPQRLRTIGAYVDHSNLRFLGLNWDGSRVILRVEGADGRSRVEEHPISSFQDYSFGMYLKRKK